MKLPSKINVLTAAVVLVLSTSGSALAQTQDYPVTKLGGGSATQAISGTVGGVPNSDGIFQVSDNLTVSALIPIAAEDTISAKKRVISIVNLVLVFILLNRNNPTTNDIIGSIAFLRALANAKKKSIPAKTIATIIFPFLLMYVICKPSTKGMHIV